MTYYGTQMTSAERTAQARLRKQALAAFRDGDVCGRCHRPMRTGQKLELDHIVPRSQGGETTWENTRLTHKACNQRAGCILGNKSPRRKFPHHAKPKAPRRLPKW